VAYSLWQGCKAMNGILCAGMLTDEIGQIINQHIEKIKITEKITNIEFIDLKKYEGHEKPTLLIFSAALKSEVDILNTITFLKAHSDELHSAYIIFLKKDQAFYQIFKNKYQPVPSHIFISEIPVLEVQVLKNILTVTEKKVMVSLASRLFGKRNPTPDPSEASENKEALVISHGSIKKGIYVITGHSGVGKTDYMANIGYILAASKIRTIIVDMDILSRGINLYYTQLTKFNSDMPLRQKSFLTALNNPEQVDELVTKINSRLDILGTSFEAVIGEADYLKPKDIELVKSFIFMLKERYDVILIEISSEHYQLYKSLFSIIDEYILLEQNTAYSINKTASILRKCFEDDQEIYQSLKYRLNHLTYRFEEAIKFEGIKLNPSKTQLMLKSLLNPYEIELKKSMVIEATPNHSHRLYSESALQGIEGQLAKQYYKSILTFFI